MDWEGFLLPNTWLSSFCLAAFLFLFFLQVICSQLSSSRSLVWCADGEASSSQSVPWCAALISPLSQTLTPFAFFCLTTFLFFPLPTFIFFYLKKKIPILLHLPWLSSTSQWLPVFECLPRAGHQWGWRTHVFAAAAWAQNPHFRWRSCCLLATVCVFMSYHLDRSPVRAEVEWEKDLEVVSSSSVVEGLCPQGWVRYTALQHHNLYFPGI